VLDQTPIWAFGQNKALSSANHLSPFNLLEDKSEWVHFLTLRRVKVRGTQPLDEVLEDVTSNSLMVLLVPDLPHCTAIQEHQQ
jgi:hypothetical protein